MSPHKSLAQVFLGDEEACDLELAQGHVCVRSTRSPDKETPNEDAAVVVQIDDEAVVFAVADGVGGSPAGVEASEIAVRTLHDTLTSAEVTREILRPVILDAVEQANAAVLALGRGAATTLVVGAVVEGQLRSYHVGDSELMAVGQRGAIKLRIIPHSPTGFAVEAGLLDEDEAVQHEQRHVLFNVIGAANMRVDIATAIKLAAYDTVLLASDGLVDNLYTDEIVQIIRAGPIAAAADRLVEEARKRMLSESESAPSKPDDLTIILYRPKRKAGRPRPAA